jgi:hypothetical protein
MTAGGCTCGVVSALGRESLELRKNGDEKQEIRERKKSR